MTSAAYRPLRPTGTGEPPAPVGRADLLARLERVLASRGRALLTGPAGVGKTELALTLAARAESRGDTVLWLPTLPTDRSIPGATAAALVAAVRARVSWPWPWTTEADAGPSDGADNAGPADTAGAVDRSGAFGTPAVPGQQGSGEAQVPVGRDVVHGRAGDGTTGGPGSRHEAAPAGAGSDTAPPSPAATGHSAPDGPGTSHRANRANIPGTPAAAGRPGGAEGQLAADRGHRDGHGPAWEALPGTPGDGLGAPARSRAGGVTAAGLPFGSAPPARPGHGDDATDPYGEMLAGLPGPQREAVAMLCREAAVPDGGWDPIALRLALAHILRTLAGRWPVLLVVDGVQRMDADSADLLRFALHLAPAALRVIAVETPEAGADTAYAPEPLWVPSEADVLNVPPLHADEIAELLIHHRLPSRMAGRIHKASGGNPRLALAVGRSLADAQTPVHHAEALSLSGRARDLARQLLGAAPTAVRGTLLLAALALRPTASLIRRAGRPTAEAELAAAERAGLVSLTEDGTVAFTAGLLPSTLVHDACWTERSEGHAALARVVDDPVEEVRHRALATDVPDEKLASEVAAAADTARRRGNSALAAELALLAAESTPGGNAAQRIARLVDAAEEAARAARADLAMRAASDLLARDASPADRVRARLAVLDTAGQGLTGLDEIYAHAMEDSEGHTALRAAVQLRLAVKYVLADGDPVRSRAAAVESAALAGSVGDRMTAVRALTVQARMERVLGSPGSERVLAEARTLELVERPPGIRNTAQILTIRHALFDDRLTDARDQLGALLPLVERRGTVEDTIELFRTLAEVEARQGHCSAALAHAERSLALTLEAGLSPGPAWFALALAETAGGSFARAVSYARRSAQASEEEGDHVFLSRSLYALGRVQLVTGDVADALETLRRVRSGERAQATVDPSVLRWHEELAEALLANDAPEEAAALLAGVRPVAERLGRTTVLLGCDRAYALWLAASGKPDEAAALLTDTAEAFGAAGLPLERGRALVALARVERRRRRRSAAQSALQSAAAVFERAGAAPWLKLATETQTPTPAGAPEPAPAAGGGAALSSLTEAELRLAQLVGRGASNQEAAAKLYLSVKTVEARLTRIYQKLDVRSRAQLAAALNA